MKNENAKILNNKQIYYMLKFTPMPGGGRRYKKNTLQWYLQRFVQNLANNELNKNYTYN